MTDEQIAAIRTAAYLARSTGNTTLASVLDSIAAPTPAAQSAGQEAVVLTDEALNVMWQDVNNAAARPTETRVPVHIQFARAILAAPVNASDPVAIRYPDECIPQKDDSSFEFAFGWNSALVRFKAMNAAPVNGCERGICQYCAGSGEAADGSGMNCYACDGEGSDIAADAQQVGGDERAVLIQSLKNAQEWIAASRDRCDEFDGARWDALQRVIDFLTRAALSADGGEDKMTDRELFQLFERVAEDRRDDAGKFGSHFRLSVAFARAAIAANQAKGDAS